MKITVSTETDFRNIFKETGCIIANTPCRILDQENENFSGKSFTSQEVAPQVKIVTDFLTQQLTRLCELMQEFRKEQFNRSHEKTTSFWATSSSSGSGSWSSMNHARY